MKNLRINIRLVNDTGGPLEFASGRELIDRLAGETGPPPVDCRIEANTEDGRRVVIVVPYDDQSRPAQASIKDRQRAEDKDADDPSEDYTIEPEFL